MIDSGRNQVYDVKADAWSEATPPPSSIQEGAAAATTGENALKRIYVFGKT
ncbi:MAG: hypothetical protein NWF09_09500 [Candidatus Bathyarchaeota archaeon]|nr:hypothetical protein [Candidatus Bathyarchaeota archaeon]